MVVLLFLPVLTGCATTSNSTYGRDFDETKTNSIVKGVTTKEELIKIFGHPNDKGLDEQNREWWVYIYEQRLSKYDIWIDKGEGQVRTKKLVITFENDIVKNFVYSDATNPYTVKTNQYSVKE